MLIDACGYKKKVEIRAMRIWIFILFGLMAFHLKAQITITSKDMPNAGESYTYSEASAQNTGFNPNQNGPNRSWNFSNLRPTINGSLDYKSALTTPYFLYFSNTIGLKTQDTLNLVVFQLTNIHDFFKKTNSFYSIVGRGFSFSGLPLPAEYKVEDKIYNFPLKYGDKDSTPFYFSLSDPTGTLPFGYASAGYRKTVVDAWGKITTPYGTFSCLRVKSTLNGTDTISIAGFSIPIPRTVVEYRFMTNGEKIPILLISGNELFNNFVPNLVQYRDIKRELPPQARFRTTGTTGQPGAEFSFFDESVGNPTQFIWNVNPPTVSYMWGTHAGQKNPIIRFDSLGVYDVSLTVENSAGQNTIRKEQLIRIENYTGTETPKPPVFQIFPNPSKDFVQICLPSDQGSVMANVYDLKGQLLLQQPSIQGKSVIDMDLRNLAAGTYLLYLQGEGWIYPQLVVKE